MDDVSFEKWQDKLAELRQKRLSDIDNKIREKGSEFSPGEFFGLAIKSLDDIVLEWWAIEQGSWQKNPPKDVGQALEDTKSELDSVIDFELEALDDDLAHSRQNLSWSDPEVDKEGGALRNFSAEQRKNYGIKIESLANKKASRDVIEEEPPIPLPPHLRKERPRRGRMRLSGGTSSSGTVVFTMFLVGLVLGVGPSVYFWNDNKKKAVDHETELTQIRAQKRAAEDTLTLVQEAFSQLAYEKIRTVPKVERDIRRVKDKYTKEKSRVERDFKRKKENLLKTVSAGDRLDRSLAKLESELDSDLGNVRRREASALSPLNKELGSLMEMMGR